MYLIFFLSDIFDNIKKGYHANTPTPLFPLENDSSEERRILMVMFNSRWPFGVVREPEDRE